MFGTETCINDMSHTIQLALAPAFLLTAVAGMLNVMASRLARIIDRGRQLYEEHLQVNSPSSLSYMTEYNNLERRRHFASGAITACTFSALLICLVIASLFLEAFIGIKIRSVAGSLFTLSTLSLVVGLTYFLREVHLATKTVRIVLPKKIPE